MYSNTGSKLAECAAKNKKKIVSNRGRIDVGLALRSTAKFPRGVFAAARSILEALAILYVCHDEEDDGWQFLDGRPVDMPDAALVAIAEIVGVDRTVLEVADLPPGWRAMRDAVGAVRGAASESSCLGLIRKWLAWRIIAETINTKPQPGRHWFTQRENDFRGVYLGRKAWNISSSYSVLEQ